MFWTKKDDTEDVQEAKRERIIEKNKRQIKKLKSFRKQGESFEYCGVTMIVERHSIRDSLVAEGYPMYPYFVPYDRARMVAAYKTDKGVIKNYYFNVSDLPALRTQNKER